MWQWRIHMLNWHTAFMHRLLVQIDTWDIQGQKFGENSRILSCKDYHFNQVARICLDLLCKYFSLPYQVIWRESMDSCKIPRGESKWILALGREFLTLDIHGHGSLHSISLVLPPPLSTDWPFDLLQITLKVVEVTVGNVMVKSSVPVVHYIMNMTFFTVLDLILLATHITCDVAKLW